MRRFERLVRGKRGGWPKRRDSLGGTIAGSSSPHSVFLRFRLLLNPENVKISSAVMGALAAGDPRDPSAALRDVAASSLNMHSRNSRTWLRAWSTLFM